MGPIETEIPVFRRAAVWGIGSCKPIFAIPRIPLRIVHLCSENFVIPFRGGTDCISSKSLSIIVPVCIG